MEEKDGALVEAWQSASSDADRIEAFARWLKSRRPLDSRARHSAFRLRAALATLDEEAAQASGWSERTSLTPPRRKSPARLPTAVAAPPAPPLARCPGSAEALWRSTYSPHEASDDIWIFGYGSILWRQGFTAERSLVGYVKGFVRRFHLGDEAHRGVPGAPGRAVTLEAARAEDLCWGCAFLLPYRDAPRILENMDVREASYEKRSLDLFGRASGTIPLVRDVIAYVVSDCPAKRRAAGYLGPAPISEMARHIATSAGPSGRNVDYLTRLDAWLRDNAIDDDHVRSLARAVHALLEGDSDEEARVGDGDSAPRRKVSGRVVVDNGAAEVVSNCARSLLAVGVRSVKGDFARGDCVAVVTVAGATIATGTAEYAAADLARVAGTRSSRCAELLPDHDGEHGVVVSKKNMVLS